MGGMIASPRSWNLGHTMWTLVEPDCNPLTPFAPTGDRAETFSEAARRKTTAPEDGAVLRRKVRLGHGDVRRTTRSLDVVVRRRYDGSETTWPMSQGASMESRLSAANQSNRLGWRRRESVLCAITFGVEPQPRAGWPFVASIGCGSTMLSTVDSPNAQ